MQGLLLVFSKGIPLIITFYLNKKAFTIELFFPEKLYLFIGIVLEFFYWVLRSLYKNSIVGKTQKNVLKPQIERSFIWIFCLPFWLIQTSQTHSKTTLYFFLISWSSTTRLRQYYRLLITLVPKVLFLHYHILWLKNFGGF